LRRSLSLLLWDIVGSERIDRLNWLLRGLCIPSCTHEVSNVDIVLLDVLGDVDSFNILGLAAPCFVGEDAKKNGEQGHRPSVEALVTKLVVAIEASITSPPSWSDLNSG
jgi:hypothetical protein